MSLLKIENLKVSFNDLEVIRGVDIQVQKGEIHGILGESGSGKSVTAFSVAKLHDQAVYQGTILFKKENILEMNEQKLSTIRGYDISYIFQNPHESFNPYKKIGVQLKEAMSIHGLNPEIDEIKKTLVSVGLEAPNLLRKYPYQLSGGECQRVMIAMSMLCEPDLIIADEPTSSIDASIKLQILNLLKKVNEENGTTIVIITHDMELVETFCHDVTIMYGGLVLEQGPVEKILDMPIHPYTKALLECSASLNSRQALLYTLNGVPMSPDYYEAQCPFYERCEMRSDLCLERIPKLKTINGVNYRCEMV